MNIKYDNMKKIEKKLIISYIVTPHILCHNDSFKQNNMLILECVEMCFKYDIIFIDFLRSILISDSHKFLNLIKCFFTLL